MKFKFDLVDENDPILRKKCSVVENPIDPEVIFASQDMERLLKGHRYKWLALAAPQVGLDKRFFVSDFISLTLGYFQVFINPSFEPLGDKEIATEMCVSLPGKTVAVPRYRDIVLNYTTLAGDVREEKLNGKRARAAQHEIDHLDGILITDYA